MLESFDEHNHMDESGYHTTSLNFNNSGDFLAVGNQEGTIKIWDMEAKKVLQTVDNETRWGRISSIAWHKSLVASGSKDGTYL